MQKLTDPHLSAVKNLYIFQIYCSATWAYGMPGEAGSFVEDMEVNKLGLQEESPAYVQAQLHAHICKCKLGW